MKVLDQEKDWLEKFTVNHVVNLEVKIKVIDDQWNDYNAFLKEVEEIASNYGFEVEEK